MSLGEQQVIEIGRSLHLRADDETIELVLGALDDADLRVQRQAMLVLRDILQERSARDRKRDAKTKSGQRAQEAFDRAAACITPQRRARIAATVGRALDTHRDDPKALLWPDWYIELLGLTATRRDERALQLLEGFRPMAGEKRRTEFEKLDPDHLPWETAMVAAKKGIAPGTPFVRVKSIATGLLDLKNLEQAIAAIRKRD